MYSRLKWEENAMENIRFTGFATLFFLLLLFLPFPHSTAQDVAAIPTEKSAAESETVESLQIKVSVNEVRLDVVVLDKKTRNPVTDLTAADFEVFQNNKRQAIVSSVYVENQSSATANPSSNRKNNRNLPSLPSADLKREDTRRTIIFVVDDISMSFEDGYYSKMALRNFVEKQMQTGDMIAILKTSYGNSALQMFLSDKREALARINAIHLDRALPPNPPAPEDDDHILYRVYDNQLSTLSYSLRALQDMPGRKILIMMTAIPKLRSIADPGLLGIFMRITVMGGVDFKASYIGHFNRLADDALRAGVVVNFLDIGGLRNHAAQEYMIYGLNSNSFNGWSQHDINMRELWEKMKNESPGNALNPLPTKTGGVTIENSNFFLDGIGKETESLMKGYYLVSYAPPADTFSSGDKEIFNQVKINVKRRNVDVYTRDGFYNRLQSDMDADTSQDPMVKAIFSPFLNADLDVNMTAGYVKDAKAGYLVRSWIHLDPKDLKIVETQDGGARIDLEMVCLTSDTNGFVQDFKHVKHSLDFEPDNKSENIAWIQKHGIRFAMLLPVKKPGFYYVRTAVRDVESGKVGSAYQFVEIPDVGKKALSLSNIFIITSADDLKWQLADETIESQDGVFFPVIQGENVRSPALRTYESGDMLQTLMVLYNADDKAIAGSEIEIQSILYRDGVELRRSEPIPISSSGAVGADGILIFQRFTIGPDMPPGDYVRQLAITDKKNSKKPEGNASQFLSFTVK